MTPEEIQALADEAERGYDVSQIKMSSASLWDALVRELGEQGRVSFQVDRQATGPYCAVRGCGVDASGYKTVEEAFEAWLETLPVMRARRGKA